MLARADFVKHPHSLSNQKCSGSCQRIHSSTKNWANSCELTETALICIAKTEQLVWWRTQLPRRNLGFGSWIHEFSSSHSLYEMLWAEMLVQYWMLLVCNNDITHWMRAACYHCAVWFLVSSSSSNSEYLQHPVLLCFACSIAALQQKLLSTSNSC